MERYEYIKLTAVDEETLDRMEEIEKSSFSHPLQRSSFAKEIENELYDVFGCFDGGRLVGYIIFLTLYEDCELMNIAVAVEERRKGIGRGLLQVCMKKAKEAGAEKLFLEVRQNNEKAIGLYKSEGFEAYGVRRGYYVCPKEDAILMMYNLREEET